ncbi:hypothetical protein SK128_011324 [Halocaridina rubra]|uniref:Uncharacterized protein n=1 Tax=Halocaridina rubra TaxID=373956 RepID=A0AAN8ZZK7_HALRR
MNQYSNPNASSSVKMSAKHVLRSQSPAVSCAGGSVDHLPALDQAKWTVEM